MFGTLLLIVGLLGDGMLVTFKLIGKARDDDDICTAADIIGTFGILLTIGGLLIRGM